MKSEIQHISFSVDFRNVDGADPRCHTITNLTFGGVVFDSASHDDEKEAAIMHVFHNVITKPEIVKEYGRIIPIFKTFKLGRVHTPSDQGMR